MASNSERVTFFAKTDSRNRQTPFGIKAKDRTRHVYVIGKTGMGKSTLLENMAVQDIKNGEGFAFVDPHGKSADLLLDYIPKERLNDVLYFAPFDMDFPIAFNVMEDVGYDKRHLVVNGLMAAFKKIWVDAWSARMEYILTNTILALLEYPGATMLSVNRMYTDKEFRRTVAGWKDPKTGELHEGAVKDPLVRSFWVDEFATYTDRYTQEATPAIQNKVGQFTGNPLIRNIVGQPRSTFDIRKMMDEGKILIVNLSKGKVGEGNANLLGSMLITKIYLAALSRADSSEHELARLPNFYLYVDEFQSFANESFADILSEARKYKLNLTLAHQYIEQMSEEVRAAVFGNVGTMIVFRVGAYDAEVLEKEFAPQFTAEDLVNLGFSQVYLKLMIDGVSSQPFSAMTLPPIAPPDSSNKDEVTRHSREVYARPRASVETEIKEEIARLQAAVDESFGRGREGGGGNRAGAPERRALRPREGREYGGVDRRGGERGSFQRGEEPLRYDEREAEPRRPFANMREEFTRPPAPRTEKNFGGERRGGGGQFRDRPYSSFSDRGGEDGRHMHDDETETALPRRRVPDPAKPVTLRGALAEALKQRTNAPASSSTPEKTTDARRAESEKKTPESARGEIPPAKTSDSSVTSPRAAPAHAGTQNPKAEKQKVAETAPAPNEVPEEILREILGG